MKTSPVIPGRLGPAAGGGGCSQDLAGLHHTTAAAPPEAQTIFLQGNELPRRWAGREQFTLLETGFGLGHNFLAVWEAWRLDPRRCRRLVFVSIEPHPLQRDDLAQALATSTLPTLVAELLAAWPPLTPNLHPVDLEGGRVQLLLGFGDTTVLLPQIVAYIDAFFLDGVALEIRTRGGRATEGPHTDASPSAPSIKTNRALERLGRLAAPGATVVVRSVTPPVLESLAAAGFQIDAAFRDGEPDGIAVGRFAPRYIAPPPPGGWQAHGGRREALIIGAGLAGCAAAWALSRQGWDCRLMDREAGPARATSGNPAGLFHGSIHADDGPHARAHRAAALLTARIAGPWIAGGRIAGSSAGCLRLDGRLPDARAAEVLGAQGLPASCVDWADRSAASALAGLSLPSGGWWFEGGGWLAPAAYAAALLADSGAALLGGQTVASLRHHPAESGGGGGLWQALDAQGQVIGAAPVLVLANALDAKRLLPAGAGAWPQRAVRGQVSLVNAADPGAPPSPRVAIAGAGYLLPLHQGALLFGATSQEDDADGSTRAADHHHNLAQLAGLVGGDASAWRSLEWQGRVGWRAVTPDRLPLIGAVVDAAAILGGPSTAGSRPPRADRPRFVPRLRGLDSGLYVFTGLGSRGIGWAALGGQLLASWITGSPSPLEADLREALDPARFALRP